eukprot:3348584-Alexandrium_andersonii.AAC.1
MLTQPWPGTRTTRRPRHGLGTKFTPAQLLNSRPCVDCKSVPNQPPKQPKATSAAVRNATCSHSQTWAQYDGWAMQETHKQEGAVRGA